MEYIDWRKPKLEQAIISNSPCSLASSEKKDILFLTSFISLIDFGKSVFSFLNNRLVNKCDATFLSFKSCGIELTY